MVKKQDGLNNYKLISLVALVITILQNNIIQQFIDILTLISLFDIYFTQVDLIENISVSLGRKRYILDVFIDLRVKTAFDK